MSLFQWGNFTLHSGDKSWWRIDCDNLTDSEIELFAKLIRERCGRFDKVVSPKSHPGSSVLRLVRALEKYASGNVLFTTPTPTFLVVDDVLTTGSSMEEIRSGILNDPYDRGKKSEVWGAVLFARGKCPDWITPIFQLVP